MTVSQIENGQVRVDIAWQATGDRLDDYGMIVQLTGGDGQCTPEAILSQVARAHLAGGVYPSSRMVRGEVVWEQVDLAGVDDARWICTCTLKEVEGVFRYREWNRYAFPLKAGRVSHGGNDADVD